ncbi:smp2 protein [Vairimorpha apis BRL 01]|uniref:Smp2 protein n=1 Tax=Vairimorpha apis BRL 01 TaxID=1037528 RepID=T0MFM9_9MICR|nr:smp2 protein [Vairimorpha apis BRL 01]
MGLVSKIFNSFSGIYNNVNIITFSGINDIIVVKDQKGKLRCSDFQLKFGRLYFPNMKAQQVHLIVNNVMIHDIPMFITPQGELCFEKHSSKDEDIHYDDVLGYINTLDKIKDDSIDEYLKMHFSKLSVKNLELDEITRKFFRNIRMDNFDKRTFYLGYRNVSTDDFYSEKAFKLNKFKNIFGSTEYYNWLINKYRQLLLILNGLFLYAPFSKIEKKCDPRGCCETEITFSNCMDRKFQISIHATFASFICKNLSDEKNIVVRLSGCKNCKCVFYFSYNFFTRMFFELRGVNMNRSKKLIELLENEHNKIIGWNLFGTKKLLKRNIAYSLRLNHEELSKLNLKYGKNSIIFKVGGVNKQLEGHIYLWSYDEKIIISDIDGTITKSDIWGHIYCLIGKDWTHVGIASLFSKLYRSGYKIMYLTARPLQQSFSTKNYLTNIDQNGAKLPEGPVILSPDGLFAALYREVVIKRPEDFKIACLENLKEIFGGNNPFAAGFGNRITDIITYKSIGISLIRIFTVDESGKLYGEYIGELTNTYKSLNDFMDSLFPPVKKGESPFTEHATTDGFYWSK